MLNSKKDNCPRISPSEVTQISFSLMPTPISNQTIKAAPVNEKMHKRYRKKWKYFSRIILRRFTVYFSKELYRVSIPVIQLQNYYIKCKFQRWIFRYKWSRMAHKIHKINYIEIIKERRLKFLEKKSSKFTPNQLKWKTMARILITSDIRSKLYLERDLLIKERRINLITKWREFYSKLRPKNLQIVQQSFIEKRHIKYIYRKYFIRWILKLRNQEDSIGYIFKAEYPEMFLNVHLNMSFGFGPYSCPFSQPYISDEISVLKDVYDLNQDLYNRELENLSDLYVPDDFDNSSSIKNAYINSFSTILSCKPIELPEIIVPTIFDDFNDMQSHLFFGDGQMNLKEAAHSISSSLSYFQSCPQFILNDDVGPDVSLSFDEFSKDSLKPLNNYKEKDRLVTEPSNIDMNIPLSLSNITGKYAKSLSQFQIKPPIKEQKPHINFDVNLSEVRDKINHSPLLNFKHYIKKPPNPKIESDVPLTFKGISEQGSNAFANYQRTEIKSQSDQIGRIYHNYNDFEDSVILSPRTKSIDSKLINYIDNESNIFENLQNFQYIDIPKTSKGDENLIDIVFVDDVLPSQQSLSSVSSIEHSEIQKISDKSQNSVNQTIDSKNKTTVNNSSIQDISIGIKTVYDGKKKVAQNSDDDISIDIELDLTEQNSSVQQKSEKIKSKSQSSKYALKSSITVYLFNPNLPLLTKGLLNYEPNEKVTDSFIFDENDLSLSPDLSFMSKQSESVIQRMNNTGPTLKLLNDLTVNDDYDKDVQIEEEEEEVSDILEEEEEEIDIDSIDFSCLSPMYLDIPTDIFNSINKSANSLDSTYLLQRESNEKIISDAFIDSSLNSSRLLAKSRYVPYIFRIAPRMFAPLYFSQINDARSCCKSRDVISKVTNDPTSLMSKVRYTPSFLNMYSPLVDRILRLSHSNYNSLNSNDINFDIKPRVIHTSSFLSNVNNSLLPINIYQKQIVDVKQPELIFEKRYILPKVRYTPHIFTYMSSILNALDSFNCKKTKFQSIKPRFINVPNTSNENKVISPTSQKKICKRIKRRNDDNIIINEVKKKDNQIISKSSSKRTVKKTTEKIVFSPITDTVDDDFDDKINVKSKSTNASVIYKSKSSSKKTKRRAASARFKRQKLPDGTTMTIRRIIIDADSTYDDENEANRSNVNIEPSNEEKIAFKSRKRKRRGYSVNNSPKKLDQK